MRKLLFLLLLVAGMANAQIVNIPDANFKARLISLGVDTSANGEIEESEAAAVSTLDVQNAQISDLTGIEAFINIWLLACDDNLISTLDVSNLTGLTSLSCNRNQISNLNVSGLLLTSLSCDKNLLTSLDLNGMFGLTNLSCYDNLLTSLDLTGFNLATLTCGRNSLTSIDLSGQSNLFILNCEMNALTTLDVSNLTTLSTLTCGYNSLTSLDVSMLPNLSLLYCQNNILTSVNVAGMPMLHDLDVSGNQLSSLDVSGLPILDELNIGNNSFTTFDFNSIPTLTFLTIEGNDFTSVNISSLVNLYLLNVAFNQLTALDVTMAPNLENLNFTSNAITSIDLSNNNSLQWLNASINQLTSLNVSNLTNLKTLICGNNAIPTLDFSGLTQLQELFIDSTGRTSINLTNQTLLTTLYCGSNPISVIDASGLHNLSFLSCGSATLTELYIKNGRDEAMVISPSANLQIVCGDESQLSALVTTTVAAGATAANVTSYCSFTPGGDFNTIAGNVRFDVDDNGCTASDMAANNLKIGISNGPTSEASIVNPSAEYAFYTSSGDYTLTPQLENPSYFTVSPASALISFPALDNSTQTQDFCLSANGVHPDLEIVLTPIGAARPGFDSNYKIVFKNKGNQTLSGTINVVFDDAHTDFVSATPVVNSQTLNSLIWNFIDLQPFESRVIEFRLNVNTPLETPAVNMGDVLDFTTSINFATGDDTPNDNISVLHQTVVNALDPNLKTCLEGNVVSPQEIGSYLHYNIEFENLGTAEAVNVVVKDAIDPTMFDINSLQVLYSSHPMRATIRQNTIEFVFENINLASASGNPPVGGHGNVLFKIKTLPTLQTGDEVENKANIYFDYNAPIETEMARTTFQMLGNPEFEDHSVVVYPNPANTIVNISSDSDIKSIELYDIQGRLLEVDKLQSNMASLDFTGKSKGVYFIRITTEKGMKVEKLVKQ